MTWMMNDQLCHLNDDNMVEVLIVMQVLTLFFTIVIEFLLCVLKDHVVSALPFGGVTMPTNETFFTREIVDVGGISIMKANTLGVTTTFGGHNNFQSRKGFPHQNQEGGHLTQNPNGHF
jgi:hypothetical protein